MKTSIPIVIILTALAMSIPAAAQAPENVIDNPSMEDGDDSPARWQLNEPLGEWETTGHTGDRCVSVRGTERGQNTYWYQENIPVEPFSIYRFSCHARTSADTTGGCIISGPDFCNRDVQAGEEWEKKSHVFITKPDMNNMRLRVGHWHKQGKIFFDDVSVRPVVAVHRKVDGLSVGDGEKIRAGKYEFSAPFSATGANYCRALESFSAGFNSNRWTFGRGSHVLYKHQVGDIAQTHAKITLSVGYHRSGACIVEASTDGEEFITVARIGKDGGGEFQIPDKLLPADAVYVRMRSSRATEEPKDKGAGSFQVRSYSYSANLSEKPDNATGETSYLDITETDPQLAVEIQDLGPMLPGKDNNEVTMRLHNGRDRQVRVTASAAVESQELQQIPPPSVTETTTIAADASRTITTPYNVSDAGDYRMTVHAAAEGAEAAFTAETSFSVPSLYAAGYGYPVTGDETADIWWCEGTYKVSRSRPAVVSDEAAVDPVKIAAARNEYEPCQIVVRPKAKIDALTAEVSDLTGPDGSNISTDNIDVCYVWYHYVEHPTDQAGCVGWWPDALPPLKERINLQANKNQPLWITVHVPSDTAAGDYSGTVRLRAQNWSKDVPIQLHVYDFRLPEEPSISSGFGLRAGAIWRYHNISDPDDKQKVWEKYMQNFRDHRLSPYQFWLENMDVDFTGFSWTGGEKVDEDAFDGDRCLKIVDDSDDRAVAVRTTDKIRLDPKAEYTLTFAGKSAEHGQTYMLSMNTHDKHGNWISGGNIDLRYDGTGKWQKHQLEFVLGKRTANAQSVQIVLRPANWTADGSATGTAWFDAIRLVKRGNDNNLVADGSFEKRKSDIEVTLDTEQWDKYAKKYLDGYNFTGFRLRLRGMGGGTFHSRHYGQIGPYKQGSDGYRRVFGEYCSKLQSHLEENGWLDEAYVYWFDEPAPKDYEFVKKGMQQIERAGPKLRRFLTEEPAPELYDAVDIWCPVLHRYDAEDCHERQKAGDTIWWYVCTGPKAPYPGLFIDHNAVDMRMWLWMSHKWDVQGVLVWATNYWTSGCAFPDEPQNPWEDPMGYQGGYGREPGYIGYWGNGDGRFLYPANKNVNTDDSEYVTGPVNSIRFEMLREGIEDFEYFTLLKKLVEKRGDCPEAELLQIPEKIIKSRTEFTHDPQPMYEHRRKVAEAIERLAD